MTRTMNTDTLRGKIVVAAVLLLGFAALVATANQADAATFCNSSASAPSVLNINGQRLVQFPARITCNGVVDGAQIWTLAQKRPFGTTTWRSVDSATLNRTFSNNTTSYVNAPRLNCGADDRDLRYQFRTVNYYPEVYALNGTVTQLATRYSSPSQTILC